MAGHGTGNIVIAAYRPRAGREEALRGLLARHLPTLRREGLVTERPPLHLRAVDGTVLEIFEWRPGGAEAAHTNPAVSALWASMAEVADFPPPGSAGGMDGPFPHFAPFDVPGGIA